MPTPMARLKSVAKRSDRAVDLARSLSWKKHVLRDELATLGRVQRGEVTTPLGFKLTAGAHRAYDAMRTGTFEPDETGLIKALLPMSDVFVDVGANLGYYTCIALQHEVHSIAIEPQPQNLRCLFQNLSANGWDDNVEVFPLVLADRPSVVTLFGASGPSASLVKDWAGYSSRFQQTMAASTLDIVLGERFGDSQLLIKIDVEGAEQQVLNGATSTIHRTIRPNWLVEICLDEFYPGSSNPHFRSAFEAFGNAGYVAWSATRAPSVVSLADVDRWISAGKSDSGTFNYIFADPSLDLRDIASRTVVATS
jgi:FkbM family methyltransferase